MKTIGIIGAAGIMANGMARNYLKHGYTVNVWNRSADKLQPLVEAGATVCATPKAVAELSDIVIECVSDDEASRAVWLGDEGILAGAKAGAVLIASSSLSLDWTDELAGLCQEHDLAFLDMPLTGSRNGAEAGTMKLLVGGDEAIVEAVRSDLEPISDKLFHFGPVGSGMRFKLILNSLIGIHMNAAAQAVELARKAGIDPAKFTEALFEGNMGPASPATKLLLSNLDQDETLLNFAIKWLEKDLRYAKQMADDYGVDFDLLNDTHADYLKAKQDGWAERDLTAIAEMYREQK